MINYGISKLELINRKKKMQEIEDLLDSKYGKLS